MSTINAIIHSIWNFSIEKLKDKPVTDFTWEDWKELARAFWDVFVEGFWKRIDEFKEIWDYYGGIEWLIPIIIIAILIYFRRKYLKRDRLPDVRALAAAKDLPGLFAALGYKCNVNAMELTDENKEMAHNYANIRGSAAVALGRIGVQEAVKPLMYAIRDLDRNVRIHAARALIEIGSQESVDALCDIATEDPDEYVRNSVLEALYSKGFRLE